MRSGLFPGGNVPHGFQRNRNGLEVEPAEAEIVRKIFELAERGESASAIARILSAKGLERRNGKSWTQRQVAAVLAHHRFYREGVLRYGEAEGQAVELALLRGGGQ